MCLGVQIFVSNIQVADWTYRILNMDPWFPGRPPFSPLTYSLGPDLLKFSNFGHMLIDRLTFAKLFGEIDAHNLPRKGNRTGAGHCPTSRHK